MTSENMGILLGGIIPAVLLGLFGVLQKISAKAGIGTGYYLLILGVTITILGGAFALILPDRRLSLSSAGWTVLTGCAWTISTGLIAIALSKYHADIAKLAPLYNMNTLVAAGLGLIIYAEWQNISLPKFGLGALLIIIGGMLVVKA